MNRYLSVILCAALLAAVATVVVEQRRIQSIRRQFASEAVQVDWNAARFAIRPERSHGVGCGAASAEDLSAGGFSRPYTPILEAIQGARFARPSGEKCQAARLGVERDD